jgi:hypothetical protein
MLLDEGLDLLSRRLHLIAERRQSRQPLSYVQQHCHTVSSTQTPKRTRTGVIFAGPQTFAKNGKTIIDMPATCQVTEGSVRPAQSINMLGRAHRAPIGQYR